MIRTTTLGFPRIGAGRALKWQIEKYFRGQLDEPSLLLAAAKIRVGRLTLQADCGISELPSGDFSLYDHVLDLAHAIGATGAPRANAASRSHLAEYFLLARGKTPDGEVGRALEMTKWFDTNYHFLVPQIGADTTLGLRVNPYAAAFAEALTLGHQTRPVLVGPVTFFRLAQDPATHGAVAEARFDDLLASYVEILEQLRAAGAQAIQLDEPILCLTLRPGEAARFNAAYHRLQAVGLDLHVTTYFGSAERQVELLTRLPIAGIHLDLCTAPEQLGAFLAALRRDQELSLGVVNGRNVWRNDLAQSLRIARPAVDRLGAERCLLAASCSLLHSPLDLQSEKHLDPELSSWLSFAVQKATELATLACGLEHGDSSISAELELSRRARKSRRDSPRVRDPATRRHVHAARALPLVRSAPFSERAALQTETLSLPPLPTTTIGSFPQTEELRRARALYRKGSLLASEYEALIEREIGLNLQKQEQAGLDVLVHGEPERNDMVEHFAEYLLGFAVTEEGWVQSYGTRCVKPPILFGDVSRARPMTVATLGRAARRTKLPVKGMLTGPVTILKWSFVRDDLPLADSANQLAVAIREEIHDLETVGLSIIQVDEPGLREGLPLDESEHQAYLGWAVDAFRLAVAGALPTTQIHTHMCYADFGEILDAIARMDADVISLECARSSEQLLETLGAQPYPNGIGPGVYDIHSPRIPSTQEMAALIQRALQVVPAERLWINPDCGLKTRSWDEVLPALTNMVAAAREQRALLLR